MLDVHLGRLAELLRLLGFDSRYRNERRDHDVFRRCAACGRLYWRGSHEQGLSRILGSVLPCPPASPGG